MTVKAIDVLERVVNLGGSATLDQVKQKIESFDRTPFEEQEKTRYKVELWDKLSPINGVDAKIVKERHKVQDDGEVYLIYIDGNLSFLQAYDPDQMGFVKMTSDTALLKAENIIIGRVEDAVDNIVIELVLEELL